MAEVMAEQRVNSRLVRIGLPDKFLHKYNSHEALLEKYGLTSRNIANMVIKNL